MGVRSLSKTLKGMTLIEGIISMVILLLAAGIMLSGFTAASKYAIRSLNQRDTSAAAQYALNVVSAYIENGKQNDAISRAITLTNEKYPDSIDYSSIEIKPGTAYVNEKSFTGQYITVTSVCKNDASISVTYTKFIPDPKGG